MSNPEAMPVRYRIYSAELAPYAPGLPEDPPEWSDELETQLRDFADKYAEELTSALARAFPGRPLDVEVVHNTTGAGSGTTYAEPEDKERVTEIANEVLLRLSE